MNPNTVPPQADSESNHDALYSDLNTLVGYRFHVKQRVLNSAGKVLDQSQGQHATLQKGSGMIFSEVRQYQPGDDIRHIDWRVSARTQKTHTKIFTEEHEKPVILVTEQTPALFFGSRVRLKAVQAMNLAALLGWTALQQNDMVGGLIFNGQHQGWIPPKRRKQTLLHWLQQGIQLQKQLSQPGRSQAGLWRRACQQLVKVVKPGSKLILIGDLLNLDQATYQQLKNLRKHSEVTAIHISDPLEKELPKLGWLNLTAGWIQEALLPLNSLRPDIRQRYRQEYQNAWEKAKKQCHDLAIPLIEISNGDDPFEALMKTGLIK